MRGKQFSLLSRQRANHVLTINERRFLTFFDGPRQRDVFECFFHKVDEKIAPLIYYFRDSRL